MSCLLKFFVLLCVMFLFVSAACEFFLSLVCSYLISDARISVFLCSSCLNISGPFRSMAYCLTLILENLRTLSPQIFLLLHFSSSSWDSIFRYVRTLILCSAFGYSLLLFLFFFKKNLFPLCVSFWITSIDLSLSSLIYFLVPLVCAKDGVSSHALIPLHVADCYHLLLTASITVETEGVLFSWSES